MQSLSMTINGRGVTAERSFAVTDPSTGVDFLLAPQCDRTQLDDAMAAASAAFANWAAEPVERATVMRRCADVLQGAADELALLGTQEQGMPLTQSRLSVERAAATFRRYADLRLDPELVRNDETARVEVRYEPLGPVVAITPWNMPLAMAVRSIAPALRAGCTMVVKPSPYTPATTLRLGELLRTVLPAGVLNVVSGADEPGAWMVEHPTPRAIAFTGSVSTGKRIAAVAGADLKRVLLELGGNDAAIVLPDAVPAQIAPQIAQRAFRNAGQLCIAIKRLYVPKALLPSMVDALSREIADLSVGAGIRAETTMGPVNNRAQRERLVELIADAEKTGAAVVRGGRIRGEQGLFLAPTLIIEPPDDSRIVREEQFGPVLPVLSYEEIDDAIARANDSMYALGASVWSATPAAAAQVAERLQAGTVWINTHGVLDPAAPFSGHKWSGLGAGNGVWGVHAFMNVQTRYLAGTHAT